MIMPIRWSMEDKVCDAYQITNAGSSALHGHHHFLLTFILKGQGIQTLNGREISFGPNDLFLLSPADFHKNTVKPGESYAYYGVKFPYELLDSGIYELCDMERFPLYIHLSEKTAAVMKHIFEQLIEECREGEKRLANKVYMQLLVEQLLILTLREMPTGKQEHADTFMNRALGYLYAHFHDEISVAEVAAYSGYTPNYFNTRFREMTGYSFGIYLRKMRLNYAENLLKSGDMSVTEIALESGFLSLAHFSRCFRSEYGISPQEYRKKVFAEKNKESETRL